MPSRRSRLDQPLALIYLRVSTAEQAVEGASLEAQRVALVAEAEANGWLWEIVTDDGYSAKDLNRPGLTAALARLDAGHADVLLATRLDRVSRSVADFAGLVGRARRRNWRLVLLAQAVDTARSEQKFLAHILAAAAEYERDLLSDRTKEGMAQRRLEGVHLGRPRALPVEVVERIVAERKEGRKLREIAEDLTADGVPTARGGSAWSTSTIQGVLASTTALAIA